MKKKIWIVISSVTVVICLGLLFSVKVNGSKKIDQDVDQKVAQNNVESYDITSYVTDEVRANTQVCSTELCLVEPLTPEKIGKDADAIVLATILSLDNADPNGSIVGMTNGKLLVNTTLSGDIAQGQVVSYSKPGGIMKMSDWEETQPDAANLKRQYLREQNGVNVDLDNTYINMLISGDIEVEAGKDYLVYLKFIDDNKYEIIGLGNGLRELNVEKSAKKAKAKSLDTTSLKIKNNETGEFESLQDYINTYIKNN